MKFYRLRTQDHDQDSLTYEWFASFKTADAVRKVFLANGERPEARETEITEYTITPTQAGLLRFLNHHLC